MKQAFKKCCVGILSIMASVSAGANVQINHVRADVILESSEISIVGYQMKTVVSAKQGVSFRTICKAPDIGSTLTVADKIYTVTQLGTIYTKDPNRSGKAENNVLNKSYTEINTTPYPEQSWYDTYGIKYIGEKFYGNRIVTFGYIATDIGILKKEDGYTSYVRTMTNMDSEVPNMLYVRPFVEANDEEGNEVIIYAQYANTVSVAEIANKVYVQGKASTKEGHDYLYDTILSKLPDSNPFYLAQPLDYGWGSVIQ